MRYTLATLVSLPSIFDIDRPVTRLSVAPPGLSIVERDGRLHVPVTHLVPARVVGSGLGKNTAWRGDYDIQLGDAATRAQYRLGSLRFGDLVAIVDADTRRGPLFAQGRLTIGVIVHGDSTVSGHGPAVTPLLTGPAAFMRPDASPRRKSCGGDGRAARDAAPPRANAHRARPATAGGADRDGIGTLTLSV
ncbi:hypothetical protein AWB67_05872 [Caballeronia terrestris]|uniref:DUF4438 domain-containing protein n=1 Tax=Caballeronia terrestris TaxID=1226301 RepID=A0A158KL97_9BURK|nr:DUF4438 domain-containing protein [Caballeronia terrestris]SAL81539.1 hypothetical protein AWB67_05872 [Caballeronia terrestris]